MLEELDQAAALHSSSSSSSSSSSAEWITMYTNTRYSVRGSFRNQQLPLLYKQLCSEIVAVPVQRECMHVADDECRQLCAQEGTFGLCC